MASQEDQPRRVTRASSTQPGTGTVKRVPPRKRELRKSDQATEVESRKKPRLSPAPGEALTNGSANGVAVGKRGSVVQRQSSLGAGGRPSGVRHISSGMKGMKLESRSGILAESEFYTIKRLPGLPDNLRKDGSNFRAFFQSLSQTTHEVIATTNTNALIWDYNTTINSPVPTTVRLPEMLKQPPLAASVPPVSTGSNKDTGLVVVDPGTGKVWYWQELDTATSYRVYSRALKWHEGSVPLFSREGIQDMLRVENGGYILPTTSGRLFYLRVKDQNGEPKVDATELKSEDLSKGGWFGSFGSGALNIFSGRGNAIASVQTRIPTKGTHFETFAVTEQGVFKKWDVHTTGQASFVEQMDLSGDVRSALEAVGILDEDERSKTPITVIDFALKILSDRERRKADPSTLQAVILIAIPADKSNAGSGFSFFLLHVAISPGKVNITRTTPIHVYRHNEKRVEVSDIKLLLPSPGHTACIVMPASLITVSLLSDVFADGRDEIKRGGPYQDIHYFNYKYAEIRSSCCEFSASTLEGSSANVLLFTKEQGAVKFSARQPPRELEKQAIGPKSKIEQEVFFGIVATKTLDFDASGAFNFQQKDVEEACLSLSREILTSSHRQSVDTLSSMENQIHWRVAQLQRLIDFVVRKYPISRAVKWQLLWDAEKLAAARELWKVYELWMERQSEGECEGILFPTFVAALNDRRKEDGTVNRTAPDPEKGGVGVDAVRHWFAKDVDKVGKLLQHLEHTILLRHKDQEGRWELLLQYISEASDVMKTMLKTAYEFRNNKYNLQNYGLSDEKLTDGILANIDDYAGLPEPWTATKNICVRLEGFVDATTELLVQLSEEAQDKASKVDKALLAHLRKHQWQLVLLTCITHAERARWLQSRDEEAERANGVRTWQVFEEEVRPAMLAGLSELGRGFDGMRIAEQLGDMEGLVALSVAEIEYLTDPEERTRLTPREQASNDAKKKEMYEKLEEYFKVYGTPFATAFFTKQIRSGRLADLLEQDFGKGKELTKFLNERPEYGGIAWMHAAINGKDLKKAGEILLRKAMSSGNAWDAWVSLNEAKLTAKAARGKAGLKKKKKRAAADDPADPDGKPADEQVEDMVVTLSERIERQKTLSEAQRALHAHMVPDFQLGVDAEGGVDIAMDRHGKYAIRDRPANEQLLKQGFEALNQQRSMSPELLIDVFTLMDSAPSGNEMRDISGKEFLYAVKVLHASGYCEGREGSKGEGIRGVLWKRLFVRDDWVRVHHTKGKRDREVAKKLKETLLFRTLKEGVLEQFWNQDGKPATFIPKPTEVLGGLSTPDSLAWRFEDPDLAAGIAKDNATEDELLTDYISRCRTAFHFEACMKLAEEAGLEAQKEREERLKASREARRVMNDREELLAKGERGQIVGSLPAAGGYFVEDDDEGEMMLDGEEQLTEEQIRQIEEDTGMEVDE